MEKKMERFLNLLDKEIKNAKQLNVTGIVLRYFTSFIEVEVDFRLNDVYDSVVCHIPNVYLHKAFDEGSEVNFSKYISHGLKETVKDKTSSYDFDLAGVYIEQNI